MGLLRGGPAVAYRITRRNSPRRHAMNRAQRRQQARRDEELLTYPVNRAVLRAAS
jgi:hypothetical protein